MNRKDAIGRRYIIQGRVQGVGFRDFVQKEASSRNVTGFVRNLPDGSVLVCAIGQHSAIADLEGLLRAGPPWAEVRFFRSEETETQEFDCFRIQS